MKDKLQQTTDREQKAQLCYAIGNAYYSMSYSGKFWMMSKLWWEIYERDNLEMNRLSSFDMQYYTAARAKPYYQQAMQLTGNPQKAAFYCMYLTHCANKEKDLAGFLSYKKKSPHRWYSDYDYHYNSDLYTRLLKRRSGSYSFYKQIIDECPLYKDFRDKMERYL